MMTPVDRYRTDPVFATLVNMFASEFSKCNQSGAGLTPTEIREASSLAWQMYCERNMSPVLSVTGRGRGFE